MSSVVTRIPFRASFFKQGLCIANDCLVSFFQTNEISVKDGYMNKYIRLSFPEYSSNTRAKKC